MPTNKTLEILILFNTLKARKHTMSKTSYLRQLQILLAAMEEHIENPDLCQKEEMKVLKLLMFNKD